MTQPRMTDPRQLALLAVGAVLLVGVSAMGAYELKSWQHDAVVWLMFVGGLVYAGACCLVLRKAGPRSARTERRAVTIILGAAVLARLLLVTAPPVSTDIYRYVWDGRVQAAGINPYRYRPADAHLAFLRDTTSGADAIFPRINRADTAVTIYPPLAQMLFLAVTRVADSVTGMKAAMMGFDCLTLVALLALLRSRGLPPTRLVLYAWHPLPLFEFAGSGHIDAAAIALMLTACLAAERRHALGAGALLGAAALIKFFPAVIAPALYRRWGWRLPAALIAVVVLLYLPYLGVGGGVFGYLPGYLKEEGLESGGGFFVLSALDTLVPLPHGATLAYVALGAATLALLAVGTTLRRRPEIIALPGALLLLAVFTLWMSPHLAWYLTWFIPFLCCRPSWALMYISVAAPLLYDIVWSPGTLALQSALYVPCALIFVLELLFSRGPNLKESSDDGNVEPRHAA